MFYKHPSLVAPSTTHLDLLYQEASSSLQQLPLTASKMASKSTETCRDCKQFRMFCMCSASGGRVIGGSKKKKRAGGHHNSRLATGATLETLAIYAATMKRKAEKSPVHSALKAEIFTKYSYNSRKLAKASVITFYSATKSGRLQFSEIVGH